jgi:hypothetical protein
MGSLQATIGTFPALDVGELPRFSEKVRDACSLPWEGELEKVYPSPCGFRVCFGVVSEESSDPLFEL